MLKDKLSVILHALDEWEKRDPHFQDKEGFLQFLRSIDLGSFNVGDTDVWMKYYREAKKSRISIPELLFAKKRELMSRGTSDVVPERSPLPERVFVIDEEKRNELSEMDERLKRDDPARRKRLNK